MKTGLFCNYENHQQDARRAIFEQVALVRQAEKLGFAEGWVSENNVNEANISLSMLVLIAHLVGVTSTIKLRTAAVLLIFHNPIRVAEDIATLNNLCNGRLFFGVAKGGLFPQQNKYFATPTGESRAGMLEAMALIQKLLYENDVSFNGQYYQCDRLTVYPNPLHAKIPVYMASGDDFSIEFAAKHSFALMGGPPFALEKLQKTISKYQALNASGAENFVLAHFFYMGKIYAEAMPSIPKFSQKMPANSKQSMQNGSSCHKPFDRTNICFDDSYLIENSIIRDVVTCWDKIKKFPDEFNLGKLALKPASLTLSKNQESWLRYNQEVRNYV